MDSVVSWLYLVLLISLGYSMRYKFPLPSRLTLHAEFISVRSYLFRRCRRCSSRCPATFELYVEPFQNQDQKAKEDQGTDGQDCTQRQLTPGGSRGYVLIAPMRFSCATSWHSSLNSDES